MAANGIPALLTANAKDFPVVPEVAILTLASVL
jgi:hypothetical protein